MLTGHRRSLLQGRFPGEGVYCSGRPFPIPTVENSCSQQSCRHRPVALHYKHCRHSAAQMHYGRPAAASLTSPVAASRASQRLLQPAEPHSACCSQSHGTCCSRPSLMAPAAASLMAPAAASLTAPARLACRKLRHTTSSRATCCPPSTSRTTSVGGSISSPGAQPARSTLHACSTC